VNVIAIAVHYEVYEIATRISRYWVKHRWWTQLSPSRSRADVWAWQCIYFLTFKPIFSEPVLLQIMRHCAHATNCFKLRCCALFLMIKGEVSVSAAGSVHHVKIAADSSTIEMLGLWVHLTFSWWLKMDKLGWICRSRPRYTNCFTHLQRLVFPL
jgi:hypothetical protein